jgi:hypothetical protein
MRADKIAVRQKKTDTPLLLPIAPELAEALQGVPRNNLNFLLTAFGAPFSFSGFGNWFRTRCNEAGLPRNARRTACASSRPHAWRTQAVPIAN